MASDCWYSQGLVKQKKKKKKKKERNKRRKKKWKCADVNSVVWDIDRLCLCAGQWMSLLMMLMMV